MGLPAMKAVRDRFQGSRISAVVGSATEEAVRLAQLFDEVIPVDRVRLLKGNKFASSIEILKFAAFIRRRRFDLVIDLHSLPETNLLGYFSGAKQRLFSRRESRSLDRLSNFDPPPPAEDKTIHLSRYYLDVLTPLGVQAEPDPFQFDNNIERPDFPIVGLNPGAGHPSRKWPLEKFIKLMGFIAETKEASVEVFLGPEESSVAAQVDAALGARCSIVRGLSLAELARRFSRLSCLVGNDTGPMHIAAASGTPLILLLQNTAPERYLPLTNQLTIHRAENLGDIKTEDVFATVRDKLNAPPFTIPAR